MTIIDRLTIYMSEALNFPEHVKTIGPDESIVESGLIDSMGVLDLIEYVEQEFNIQLDPEDMELKHFETLNSIKNIIETYQLKQTE